MAKMESALEKLNSLLDYTNGDNYGNYSPNNIKSIIISQDGFYQICHMPSLMKQGHSMVRGVSKNFYYDYKTAMENGGKYKSILSVINKERNRKFNGLEEIVILTGCSNNLNINDNFMNFEVSLGISDSFISYVKNNNYRMKYISVFDMKFDGVDWNTIRGILTKNKEMTLTELFLKNNKTPLRLEKINLDTWYQKNPCTPKSQSTYPIEKKSLVDYFDKIKKEIEDKEHDKKLEKYRKKQNNESVDEYLKYLTDFKKYYAKFKQALMKETNVLHNQSSLQNFKLQDVSEQGEISDKEYIESIKKALEYNYVRYCDYCSGVFLDALIDLSKKAPTTCKVIISSIPNDIRLAVGSANWNKAELLNKEFGASFVQGKSLSCMSTPLIWFSKIFINKNYSDDYWTLKNIYRKAGTKQCKNA